MKGLVYLCPFLIAILIGLGSCRRERCQNPGTDSYTYLKIGDSTRSKVPHTGYDTIIFYNQYGDTVFLRGIGVQKSTTEFTYQGDPECGGGDDHYFTDNERLNYRQDDQLSNTSRHFPLSYINISADSNNHYIFNDNTSGIIIMSYKMYYYELQDTYYKETIELNNIPYKCLLNGHSHDKLFYYNHYDGVLKVIENDTVIWERKLN